MSPSECSQAIGRREGGAGGRSWYRRLQPDTRPPEGGGTAGLHDFCRPQLEFLQSLETACATSRLRLQLLTQDH